MVKKKSPLGQGIPGVLFIIVVSLLTTESSFGQDVEGLFLEVPDAHSGGNANNDETVVRRRLVGLNPNVFPTASRQPGFFVRMNFFPGAELNVVLEKLELRSDSDYTWTGSVEGEGDGGKVTLVVKRDVLVANVRSEKQGFFQVRTDDSGVVEVREINPAGFASREGSDVIEIDTPSPEAPEPDTSGQIDTVDENPISVRPQQDTFLVSSWAVVLVVIISTIIIIFACVLALNSLNSNKADR